MAPGSCYSRSVNKLSSIVSVAFLLLVLTSTALAESQTPEFKMWLGAGTPEMQRYDYAVMEGVLAASQDQYGEYRLTAEKVLISHRRQERIFRAGSQFELTTAPLNQLLQDGLGKSYQLVAHPIMSGALGYRRLLVRVDSLPKMKSLSEKSQLQKLEIGQVESWADVNVLRENGVKVITAQNFDHLFPMLRAKRFDAIAIGVSEASAAQDFIDQHYPDQFTFVPNVVIFYPFSVFLVLKADDVKLLARLEYGMDKFQQSGQLDRLFEQELRPAFDQLKTDQLRVIVLDNPLASAQSADPLPRLLLTP